MRGNIWLRIAFFLSALLMLVACSRNAGVTVAIHPWIGYEPLFLARDFGWLPERVKLLETANASASLKALETGAADAAALTLDEMLSARVAGLNLTAVLVFDVSAGADVVMARPAIAATADLAGQRVALEHSAVGELMLTKVLETAGLTRDEVVLLDIPPHQQVEAWRDGQFDAAVTYEPAASQLQKLGAQRLFDSREIPDTIFDVLAVRRERLGRAHQAIEAVVAAHFRALEHLRVNRDDAVYRIAQHQGISPAAVNQALAGVRLPGRNGNRLLLASDSPMTKAADSLNRLMVKHQLLPRPDQTTGLVTEAFLPRRE